ncbi:PREDICTED: translation initiation factor IF-2-like, partial [Chinchilla lanigera]|uniref:translation initiation factor IF-2-like n=1 Tax=Chinchilla lanigera TaxID=34839 RepID=UPI0006961BFE
MSREPPHGLPGAFASLCRQPRDRAGSPQRPGRGPRLSPLSLAPARRRSEKLRRSPRSARAPRCSLTRPTRDSVRDERPRLGNGLGGQHGAPKPAAPGGCARGPGPGSRPRPSP